MRCFRTYLRIRRCACVHERILRVCRTTGSLSCLRRAQAGMALGTTVSYAERSHMKQQTSEALAAFVGLDWADAQHDVCLQAAGTAPREFLSLEHSPEEINAWVQTLRTRFNGPPVAVCLELTKGPLVSALRTYDFLVLFPVHPLPVATYREALTPSRATDDPTDAEPQVEILRKHRDTPPPSAPTAPPCAPWRHLSSPAGAWSATTSV